MKLRKHLLTAAMIMALGISAGGYAAEAPEQNPWGLVYRGAITHNVMLMCHKVTHKNL